MVARRATYVGAGAALGTVLLLLVSGGIAAGPAASRAPSERGGPIGAASFARPAPVLPTDVDNTTLSFNTSSVNLSGEFWGTTVSNEVHLLRGEQSAVNATPARVLVWPGAMAGEDYDPFTETHYATDSGAATPALTTEAQFVQFCEAIHCTAIMQVPAEIDDPSFAEAIVNYTERNLSFTPAYWMIGNEPELWEHWQVPWADWGSEYTNGPSPTEFGHEVVAYVDAIRQVDNSTPILGLPASGCTCGYWTYAQWISGVLSVTGDKIQAVAFHEYPAGWLGTGDGSLTDFYETLQSAANIPTRIVAARAAVRSACPGCNVSVFVSELGSALSWSAYGQYAAGFSGALSIASQITQAMDYNVSNVDLFASELATTNSWFAPSGSARPDYALYTGILPHLGTESYSVDVPGLSNTLYGIATVDPADHDREDLLVVNDNITQSIDFAPGFAGGLGTGPVEEYAWNGSIHDSKANRTTWVEPYTPEPVPTELPGGLPESYVLPPQSLVLFESYPDGGTYVRVSGDGVPNGTEWYTDLGGRLYGTTDANLSLLLEPGSYAASSIGIPLPLGGREYHPDEQLGPFVSSPAEIGGASTNLSVDFVDQWAINDTPAPTVGGTVTPAVQWWNASTPLTLTAHPAPGYALARWVGWGPGSVNGTGPSITIDPQGRVDERATFVPGDDVVLYELSLPDGTPWSVTVRGWTTDSTGSAMSVYEPPGIYGFTVDPVPGYRSVPTNGSFVVGSAWSELAIHFYPISPPAASFPVAFDVQGLPTTDPVDVSVRGSLGVAGPFGPEFTLANGSYAYRVGLVPGFHLDVAQQTFDVTGAALTIQLPFVPTVYAIAFSAAGTRAGLPWQVELPGRTLSVTSAWAAASLPNGTYPFVIDPPPGFGVVPRSGTIAVHGGALRIYPSFAPAMFPAAFTASGPGATSGWSVRLGNVTLGASGSASTFEAPNGTYTFDVHPPAGYYADPSHGTVTVSGGVAPLRIQLLPTSVRPSGALIERLDAGALSVGIWLTASTAVGFVAIRGLVRRGGRES